MTQAELGRLRSLLLDEEQTRLEALERRLDEQGPLEKQLAGLLPAAVAHAAESDPKLGIALQKPIREGVALTVREDAEGFAEILFPIMGPSIRRAIAEALKDFTRSLNHSMGRGLLWRVEALRRGLPYSEVLLEHTMAYRVEQALLIQSATGLVISKAELSAAVAQDSDAFSAMLNVIQDFIRDSFSGESQISTLELGNRTVWITPGQHAHLACVISGTPGQRLRHRLADTVDLLQREYPDQLENFTGDRDGLGAIDIEVERCLKPDEEERAQAQASYSRWPLLLLLLLLAGLTWWAWGRWSPSSIAAAEPAVSRAEEVLNQLPGVLIHSVEQQDGQWTLRGLRDPLSADPTQQLQAAGIPTDQLRLELIPFVSLTPAMVERRARQALRLPEGVQMHLAGSTLVLSGEAEADWVARVQRMPVLPPGIEQVDSTALSGRAQSTSLEDLRQSLEVPPQVQMSRSGQALSFTGVADLAWIRSLPARLQTQNLRLAGATELEPREWQEALALAKRVHERVLYFDEQTVLNAASGASLDELAATIRQLDRLAERLQAGLTVNLVGYTDARGDASTNLSLRRERSLSILRALQARQVPGHRLQLDAQPNYVAPAGAGVNARKLILQVHLSKPQGGWL